nr:cyclic nucleotide-binding domain-containing protein [Trabulsiella odontotermitis]
MSRGQLQDVIRQSPPRQYRKKQYLWREGDKCSGLWLIKYGVVRTFYINATGIEQITGFYLPGEYVGIDELPGEWHRGYALVTADCAVHQLPQAQLDALMETCEVRRQVYQLMSECLYLNRVRVHQLRRLSAGEKLAGFIYDIASRSGFPGSVLKDFRLPALRCDIANYTGVAPETVTREMLKMVDAGAFLFSGKYITGLRPAVMETLTGDQLPCRSAGP